MSFEHLKQNLKPFGLWISSDSRLAFKILGIIGRVTLIELYLFLQLMYLPYVTNLEDFTTLMSTISTYVSFTMKALNMNYHAKALDRLSIDIEDEMRNFDHNEKFTQRVAEAMNVCKKLSRSATVTCLFWGIFPPIFNHQLGMMMWFPYDLNNPFFFWSSAIFQCAVMVFGSRIDVFLEMTPVVYMAHVIAMLEQLCDKLESLKSVSKPKTILKKIGTHQEQQQQQMAANLEIKENRTKLIKLMKSHQNLVEISTQIQRIFDLVLFVRIFMSNFVMCTTAFSITIFTEISLIIPFVMYIAVTTCLLLIPCYYANEVSIVSDRLSTSLFHSEWYLVGDKEYRQTVLTYMMLLRRKIKITSAKIFEVNLETFMRVCNFAFSIYAVFKKINE
jgi:hypothetical protein